MKLVRITAPMTDRVECRISERTGFWLCDEKRWNDFYHSRAKRFYMPVFAFGRGKICSVSFDKLPLLNGRLIPFIRGSNG